MDFDTIAKLKLKRRIDRIRIFIVANLPKRKLNTAYFIEMMPIKIACYLIRFICHTYFIS